MKIHFKSSGSRIVPSAALIQGHLPCLDHHSIYERKPLMPPTDCYSFKGGVDLSFSKSKDKNTNTRQETKQPPQAALRPLAFA